MFKKIKKRIKRALAALLREELLEYIGYCNNLPYQAVGNSIMFKEIPFDTVSMEAVIPLRTKYAHAPHESNYEGFEFQLQKYKEDFARQVIEHIHVDTKQLTSDEDFMQRSIRLTLRVQRKQYQS